MKSIFNMSIAAAALLGAAVFTGAPAQARTDFSISIGVPNAVGYDYNSGGYCDSYGCPDGYWDYPVWYGPVYWHGAWYRGPVYYRDDMGDRRTYWIAGGWHHDQWHGSRPDWWDRGHYYAGPALGYSFYVGHGFRHDHDRYWHGTEWGSARHDHEWNDHHDRDDHHDVGTSINLNFGGNDHHDHHDHDSHNHGDHRTHGILTTTTSPSAAMAGSSGGSSGGHHSHGSSVGSSGGSTGGATGGSSGGSGHRGSSSSGGSSSGSGGHHSSSGGSGSSSSSGSSGDHHHHH